MSKIKDYDFSVEIPPDLVKKLEALPPKPGSWVRPEIDKILLTYGEKKNIQDLAKILSEHYHVPITARGLQNRLQYLRDRARAQSLDSPIGDDSKKI